MKNNMNRLDIIIRVVAGISILVLGLIFRSWWGLMGIMPLLVSVTGFCPLYAVLKIDRSPATAPPLEERC